MTDQPKEIWSICKCGSIREGTPQANEQAICPDCKRVGCYVLADDQPKDLKPTPEPWTTFSTDHYEQIVDANDNTVIWWPADKCPPADIRTLIAAAPDTAAERDQLKEWSYHVEIQCVIRHPETGDWNCLFCKAQLDGEESSATIKHTPSCLITIRDAIAKAQEIK